jgi:hypothetical protein
MVLADCPCPGVKGAHLPTKENILHSIERLVTGAKAGDMLYFSFSGHGTQVPDHSGEEADGLDEAIVPGDFAEIGRVITDDELAAYLVAPLTEGVLLTCIFDCCHSGTILDLDSAMDSTKGKGDKRKSGKKKYSKREISAEELAEYADVQSPKHCLQLWIMFLMSSRRYAKRGAWEDRLYFVYLVAAMTRPL